MQCFRKCGTPEAGFRLAASSPLEGHLGFGCWKQAPLLSDCTGSGAGKRSRFFGLEGEDFEAWDEAEVSEIDGQNREAEGERRSSDQQVCEGDSHALGLLLSVDLSGQHCGLFRVGIDRKIAEQFLDEGLAAQPPLWGLCAIDTVDEFGQSDGGESGVLIARHSNYLLDQLPTVSPRCSAVITMLESRISPLSL
jgi:hypothetical protein